MSDFIYSQQAKKVSGVTWQALEKWIKRGYIDAKQLPTGRWLISEQSLRNFVSGRGALKVC
jgi:predicted site-specific integrase-resolvase